MASHDMERPAARELGTGTLAVRRSSRDSRDAEHGTISRTNSSSRMSSGRSTPTEQLEGPAARDRDTGRRDSREDVRGSDGGRGRFEGPARAGGGGAGGHQHRTAESSRGSGGTATATARGSKRGRSVDSDRGGGREAERGFDAAEGGGDGDPSKAFDSKRMRQPDPAVMEPEGGGVGPSRSSVEGWGRGYSGGGVPRDREREGPAAPSDGSSGRYRDEANPRHGGGSGGGRMPMPMPSREVHMDRPTYEARGGGRAGRSGGGGGGGLDVGAIGEDQDRSGGHRDREARGGREHPPDDDARSRSSRDGGKKTRSDRQRSGSSRGEDGGGGGSRKEKKKSSKSKKKKH